MLHVIPDRSYTLRACSVVKWRTLAVFVLFSPLLKEEMDDFVNQQEEEMVKKEMEFLREMSEDKFLEVMLGESLYFSCCVVVY